MSVDEGSGPLPGLSFGKLLAWHLENGTRPPGSSGQWSESDFVAAIGGKNQATDYRSVKYWLNDEHHPNDTATIERILFGNNKNHHAEWRRGLRDTLKFDKACFRAEKRYHLEKLGPRIHERILNGIAENSNFRENGWQLDKLDYGEGATNVEFNRKLVAHRPEIKIEIINEIWLAGDYNSKDLALFAIYNARKNNKGLFNGKKIRVSSEFLNKNSCRIQQSDYFSYLATEDIAFKKVSTKKLKANANAPIPDEVIWNGTDAFLNEDGGLKSFGETLTVNSLNCSTLAFSQDGHLMVVVQSEENYESAHMLGPSGSGSLDWSDIAASNADDLLSLVEYGGKRELQEECSLDTNGSTRPAISCKVMVTGYTRWVHRGGQPEFYCIGKIYAPERTIRNRKPEKYVKAIFTAGIESADWTMEHPQNEVRRICERYLTKCFNNDNQSPISYPLEHMLKHLIEACKNEETGSVIGRFMRAEPGEGGHQSS
jgi:hypothetical protein